MRVGCRLITALFYLVNVIQNFWALLKTELTLVAMNESSYIPLTFFNMTYATLEGYEHFICDINVYVSVSEIK